jgi:hypothetical protein
MSSECEFYHLCRPHCSEQHTGAGDRCYPKFRVRCFPISFQIQSQSIPNILFISFPREACQRRARPIFTKLQKRRWNNPKFQSGYQITDFESERIIHADAPDGSIAPKVMPNSRRQLNKRASAQASSARERSTVYPIVISLRIAQKPSYSTLLLLRGDRRQAAAAR